MTSVEDALRAVERALRDAAPGGPARERVALAAALGRVVLGDVAMDHDVPPFRRATMDGYAVRAADLASGEAVLTVVGRVVAGGAHAGAVGAGEAVAVTTGAPVPDGADAVVPIEATERVGATEGDGATERVGARVRLRATDVTPGRNVASLGEQARAGDRVVRAPVRVTPALVGVLAAAGATTVEVARRPRVAIVSTGDELVDPARTPGPSQIRESNGAVLVAQATAVGANASHEGPVADRDGALAAAAERGLAADVLCLSGGVSMGERDLVPGVLAGLGVECAFHRWAVQPGGPLWFGRRGGTLVFGLPGNPAATFVGFELLVAPALRALLGFPFAPAPVRRARFLGTVAKPSKKRRFLPVALASDGATLVARPVRSAGSGDLFALARADAFAVVPEGVTLDAPDASEVDVLVPGGGGA